MQICVTDMWLPIPTEPVRLPFALENFSNLITVNTSNSRVFMAPKPQAHWSEADTNTLIDFLVLQLPTVGDGTGFKATVWNEAATKVNTVTKTKAKGCDKTGSSCKNKFARVRVQPFLPASFLLDLF
jgi:hypothetical protein